MGVLTLIEMETAQFVWLRGDDMKLISKVLGQEITDHNGVRLAVTLKSATYIMTFIAVAHAVIGRVVMAMLEKVILVHSEKFHQEDPGTELPPSGPSPSA